MVEAFFFSGGYNPIVYSGDEVSDDKAKYEAIRKSDKASQKTYSIADKELSKKRKVWPYYLSSLE